MTSRYFTLASIFISLSLGSLGCASSGTGSALHPDAPTTSALDHSRPEIEDNASGTQADQIAAPSGQDIDQSATTELALESGLAGDSETVGDPKLVAEPEIEPEIEPDPEPEQAIEPIDIREMSTAEEKQPAAKLNTEITSVEQMRSDDDAFDDMKMVDDDGQKGTVEIVMDDTATPATIKEEPLDFSDSDGMTFTNNESGDQSINNGDLPF